MRRAQGWAANPGARAALIGGADHSSNTGISAVLRLPPKGTHAHSMVQAFLALGKSELDAFRAYADVYPDDCLLLVDTIDTLNSGIPNAITVFRELEKKGHRPVGIRLDSGDLAYLSILAGKMFDEAGLRDTLIVLSNRLDELVIWQILTQIRAEAGRYGVDAEGLIGRLVFGVGTGLITSHGDAALDGVYKLSGVNSVGRWIPALKISETPAKIINPGVKKLWRIYDRRLKATADLVTLSDEDPRQADLLFLHHPVESEIYRMVKREDISRIEPLLTEVMRAGRVVCELPGIEELRRRRLSDVDCLDSGVRRLINPHVYHVSISRPLWELKERMIRQYKR
jgi:nicotinate phosphoribosyltransferase